MSGFLFMIFIIAGLVLLFNGLVQLSVRKKTGPWKEGGASLVAYAIIDWIFLQLTPFLLE